MTNHHYLSPIHTSIRFLIKIVIFIAFTVAQPNAYSQSHIGFATKKVNLREGPDIFSLVVTQIQASEQVFVISKEPTNDFLNVIYIETGDEGWVHKSFVKIQYEIPKNSDSIFTPEGKISSDKPEIEIFNNTYLKLTLSINEKKYSFDPGERKTLTLDHGICTYRASAPRVIPYYGEEVFKSNYRYSWQFYIEKR